MRRRQMVKKLADHNPSFEIGDIRLAERQYLIRGLVTSVSEAETQGGIWIPITEEMKIINLGKVLKVGPGCTLAAVGEYIAFSCVTGENFNHLKPQPIYRDYFDEDGLYTLHEDNVRAVIPEARAAQPGVLLEEKNDGKDCSGEEGGSLSAADPEPE